MDALKGLATGGAGRAAGQDDGGSNSQSSSSSMDVVKVVYKDYPENLWVPAEGGVVQVLRKRLNGERPNWHMELPHVMAAINGSVHSTTGASPHFMLYGRPMPTPLTRAVGWPEIQGWAYEPTTLLPLRLKEAYERARIIAQEVKEQQKRLHDRKSHDRHLKEGDIVGFRIPKPPPGVSRKIHPRYTFPYEVVRVDYPNVQIRRHNHASGRVREVHMDSLKIYGDEAPTASQFRLVDPNPTENWDRCLHFGRK